MPGNERVLVASSQERSCLTLWRLSGWLLSWLVVCLSVDSYKKISNFQNLSDFKITKIKICFRPFWATLIFIHLYQTWFSPDLASYIFGPLNPPPSTFFPSLHFSFPYYFIALSNLSFTLCILVTSSTYLKQNYGEIRWSAT